MATGGRSLRRESQLRSFMALVAVQLLGLLVMQAGVAEARGGGSLRRLLAQDCHSLDCCLVQCTPPPQPPTYAPGQPYCCPVGTQCQGDASSGKCEQVGGGGPAIDPLTLSQVTVPAVNQYTTGNPTSGANPCNFNGQTWYCPETLNCGRTYLDCLPSDNYQALANHGY